MKKFFKHPITIALISCLFFTPIGSAIYDHTKNVPVLTDIILKPFSVIWNGILSFIAYKVSIGSILITLVLLIGLIFSIDKIFFSYSNQKDFLDFKSGVLKQWKWSWEWSYNYRTQKYNISHLRPYCHKCDIKMIADYRVYVFDCPNCNLQYNTAYNTNEDKTKIEALILDRIDKGNF